MNYSSKIKVQNNVISNAFNADQTILFTHTEPKIL